MPAYFVYRWHDLGSAPLSRLRKVGEVWEITDWRTMPRAELRRRIMMHPRNLSPVPHPLIDVPVAL